MNVSAISVSLPKKKAVSCDDSAMNALPKKKATGDMSMMALPKKKAIDLSADVLTLQKKK